jgi:hypothetical protein
MTVDERVFISYNTFLMAKSTKTTGKKRTAKSSSKLAVVKPKKAFRSYNEAISYLFNKTDYEKEENLRYNITTFNLDRMKKLLSLVRNPQKERAQPLRCWPKCSKRTAIL